MERNLKMWVGIFLKTCILWALIGLGAAYNRRSRHDQQEDQDKFTKQTQGKRQAGEVPEAGTAGQGQISEIAGQRPKQNGGRVEGHEK